MRIVRLSQGLFAIASAGLGIWSLAYGGFGAGGQPLPAWIPWREFWVDGSALLVLGASAGLLFSRTAPSSVLTIGAYHAVLAAARAPPIFSQPLSVEAWYPLCEALTPLAGAWVLYVILRSESPGAALPNPRQGALRAAQVLFGLTCVFYGWSHFAYAHYTAGMVPTWLPDRRAWAYLTGLGHLGAGIAIIVGILPRLAATLEAIMMSLFGLLVWVPSFFAQPRPGWATPPENQWSELVVSLLLAASAWIVATSLRNRSWTFTFVSRSRL